MEQATAGTTLRNAILNSLDRDEAARIAPHLKRVSGELGDPILQPGDPIDALGFPESAMASAMGITAEGATAEVGLIGWEGVVGLPRLFGSRSQPNVINFQMPGNLWLLPAKVAEEEFARGGNFQRAVLRFANAFMVQIGRTAVCNAVHGVDKRLAKWLLMCHDRSTDNGLRLTQEFLAMMVSVSRQSISGGAQVLQERGLIKYSRGLIEVTYREGLEKAACDCYQIISLRGMNKDLL